LVNFWFKRFFGFPVKKKVISEEVELILEKRAYARNSLLAMKALKTFIQDPKNEAKLSSQNVV